MEPEKSLKEDWFLWFLLGLALILVLGYWFLLETADERATGPNWLFADVPAQSIKTIRRYEGDQLKLEVSRSATGSGWTIQSPESITVDPEAVDRWVNRLIDPEVSRRFKSGPDSDYGFDRSDTRIQVVVNETKHDLYMGGESPTGDGFYLRYGSGREAPVFLMPQSIRSSLDLTLYEVRDKQLFDEKIGSVTGLELRTGEGRVLYRKEGENWILSEPKEQKLNDTQSLTLEKSLSSLRELRADHFHDDEVPSEFTSEQGQLILRTGEQERILTIGGTREGRRLVRVNDEPVVAVSQDPVDLLKDSPEKPAGWPETIENDNDTPDRDLPERIKNMRSKGKSSGRGNVR